MYDTIRGYLALVHSCVAVSIKITRYEYFSVPFFHGFRAWEDFSL